MSQVLDQKTVDEMLSRVSMKSVENIDILIRLTTQEMAQVLCTVSQKDILKALKTASDKTREAVLRPLSDGNKVEFLYKIAEIGPTPLSEVEQCQRVMIRLAQSIIGNRITPPHGVDGAIEVLDQTLSEYEIIENDIADLIKYKTGILKVKESILSKVSSGEIKLTPNEQVLLNSLCETSSDPMEKVKLDKIISLVKRLQEFTRHEEDIADLKTCQELYQKLGLKD